MTMLQPAERPAVTAFGAAAADAAPPTLALSVDALLDRAGRKIAPLWPLKHFVAVNPFLGLSALGFDEATRLVERTSGGRMIMPRSFFADAIRDGRIADADLGAALASAHGMAGTPPTIEELKAIASAQGIARGIAQGIDRPPPLPTVADTAMRLEGHDWPRFVTDRISRWAAARFDEGQAAWRSPWRDLPPFSAWKAEAEIDRTPDILGLTRFSRFVAEFPDDPGKAAVMALDAVRIPAHRLEDYLHRLLMTVSGWAGYARYRLWEAELRGGSDDALSAILTIRLVWDAALLVARSDTGLGDAWRKALDAAPDPAPGPTPGPTPEADRRIDLILQDAFEHGWRRDLFAKLAAPRQTTTHATVAPTVHRPAVQAAFCIDVRSEFFRRALETVLPEVETIGFAGFFGFPIEYVPLGRTHGGAQCPVLLTPKFTVCEAVQGVDADTETEVLGLRLVRLRAARAWTAFKQAAVSSFAFVETLGLGFAVKLATDSLGTTRPVKHPMAEGLDRESRHRLGPRIAVGEAGGRTTGFDATARIGLAESVLRAMSMTRGFARLVLLAGHGATTVNNPHATGLDCGACGGHTGEANARVAAAILNDPKVRIGLAQAGISIPADTVFLAGLHDTTTDEVTLFDLDSVPATHRDDMTRLQGALAAAGRQARAERARLLRIEAGPATDANVLSRSRDWSQVRPEWGLAGCAAFIAAPRHRTRGLDLGGRSFLHDYDRAMDEGFGVLELIMTAPMMVASWINLQYYGSTVDNPIFGSGNKVLHNVVGTLGVLEGNGGDLRTGLPWQAVHDGERYVHEPMRLAVLIEAPIDAMTAIIDRHPTVRALLDNGWLHLFAMGETGTVTHRYAGDLLWGPVGAD